MTKKSETRNSIKNIYDSSSIGKSLLHLKEVWSKNKKLIIVVAIVLFVLCVLLTGSIKSWFLVQQREIRESNILMALYCGMRYPECLIISFILFFIVGKQIVKLISGTKKTYERDEEQNYNVSTENYKGSAIKMTDKEREYAMTSGNYLEQKDNILGCDLEDNELLYALKKNYGKNKNMIFFGSPGCGKSRCYVIPFIFQTIRRKESIIVTDPKGELYSATAELARAHGYTVKIFNMDMDMLLHSDSIDFLACVGDNLAKADNMAKTIIANLYENAKPDFWYSSELNLLKAAILFVNTNEIGIKKSLGGIYEWLAANTPESLEEYFFPLPDDHPAKQPFNVYANGDKTVKGNTLSGLLIKMGILANKQVQEVTGTPDIDLALPGKEKCIYYIGMNDQDRTLSFFIALFFSLTFQQLVGYTKTLTPQELPVRVTMLLDEFYSIGIIPDFEVKISNLRSRGIDNIIILQNLAQLQSMYPENLWKSIIGCCSTKVLISVDEPEDSKYFSDWTGEQTTEDESERVFEKVDDPIKFQSQKQMTRTHGERMVYTPHEIRNFSPDNVLVFISKCNVVELKKLDYETHPMCKEIRVCNPNHHAPKWVLDLNEEKREKYRIYDETYRKEGIRKIDLCKEADFMEPWTAEKKAELEKKIAMEEARRRKKVSS